MDPANLLIKVIGTSGRWQIFVSILIFLCKFGVGWFQLLIVVQAPIVEFTCSDANFSKCDPDCPGYEFDRSVWQQTIQMEWNLVCQRAVLTTVMQTVVMAGILLGNIVFGYLSDRFGRRNPLLFAVVLELISGCGAAFAPWFTLFVILRFLCTFAVGGGMLTSFVILMEFTAKNWRVPMGVLFQIPFNLGFASLGLIGYYVRRWDIIQLWVSVPQLALLLYCCFLPESPRWLLTMKKHEKLIKLLERVAKCNKRPVDNIRGEVEAFVASTADVEVKKGGNIIDLFRTPRMRTKTLILVVNWFTIGACYFGVAQFLGEIGNTFINISCAGLIQVPGNVICIFTLIYIGRKWSLIGSFIICFVPCFIIACLNDSYRWTVTILGSISEMGISMGFSIIYIYTSELYPTQVRNIGMGLCSMTARIGSMLCPYVMLTRQFGYWMAPVILGIFPVISALLTLIFLPETVKLPMVDTIEEADAV